MQRVVSDTSLLVSVLRAISAISSLALWLITSRTAIRALFANRCLRFRRWTVFPWRLKFYGELLLDDLLLRLRSILLLLSDDKSRLDNFADLDLRSYDIAVWYSWFINLWTKIKQKNTTCWYEGEKLHVWRVLSKKCALGFPFKTRVHYFSTKLYSWVLSTHIKWKPEFKFTYVYWI